MEAPTLELTRDNFNSIFFQTFIKTKVQTEIPILRCAVPLPKTQKLTKHHIVLNDFKSNITINSVCIY